MSSIAVFSQVEDLSRFSIPARDENVLQSPLTHEFIFVYFPPVTSHKTFVTSQYFCNFLNKHWLFSGIKIIFCAPILFSVLSSSK